MNPVFRLVSASIAASPLAGYLVKSHIARKWGRRSAATFGLYSAICYGSTLSAVAIYSVGSWHAPTFNDVANGEFGMKTSIYSPKEYCSSTS